MKKSRIEFIKRAHNEACREWKTNIEKEFPEIFQYQIKEGEWYYSEVGGASKMGYILVYPTKVHSQSKIEGHGWTGAGEWKNYKDHLRPDRWGDGYKPRAATKEEIEQKIILEANKRKYSRDNFWCLHGRKDEPFNMWYFNGHGLYTDSKGSGGYCVFKVSTGEWAEIKPDLDDLEFLDTVKNEDEEIWQDTITGKTYRVPTVRSFTDLYRK